MKTKRILKKAISDKKITDLSEKIKEKERQKNIGNDEQKKILGHNQNSKSAGEIEAEIEYYKYITPLLEDLEQHKQAKREIVSKAKEEYRKKTKEVLQELKELEEAERKLFGGGGRSNQWIAEKNQSSISGDRVKPLPEIAQGIIELASIELEQEHARLALIEARKKEAEKQKEEERSK